MNTRSKLSRVDNLEKETYVETKAEKVEMTLNTKDSVASGLLIQRLTELYEDPAEASVRETVSNAIDAVTEAHNGARPEVNIESPSSFRPRIIVRDNGVGMTYNDLKEIYSTYGASTKADNLEQIGAYGLGAKSPLAYGREFTVTSIKDNQKTTIIVKREETTNYIEIVNSEITDEPMGTEVIIPIKSSDVDRFKEHIEKYKETPLDKDVDLYIDDKLVKNEEFVLLTDNLLIHEGHENVYGRVWIEAKKIINLITELRTNDISRAVKYVIGGWAYETPEKRDQYFYSNDNIGVIAIELKAGIVGFNSSRDAILENDRYEKLNKLVIDYFSSDSFMDDITEVVNDFDLDNFKNVISQLVNKHIQYIVVEDGKISVNHTPHSYSSVIGRSYDFGIFEHNETGFNIDSIIKGVPKETKPTAVIQEKKETYKKTVDNYIFSDEGYYSGPEGYAQVNISEMNSAIDKIFQGEEDSHDLGELLVSMYAWQTRAADNSSYLFVTDIDNDEDLRKLKNGRKTLVKISRGSIDRYQANLIFTKHSKKEIKAMLNTFSSEFEKSIFTAEEAIEEIKEYRAENKKKSSIKRKKKDLELKIYRYDFNDKSRYNVNADEISESTENVFVSIYDKYHSNEQIRQIHNWYSNKYQKDEGDFELYLIPELLTVRDIELLLELGEIYRSSSVSVGRSKLYYEKVHDNVVGMDIMRDEDIDNGPTLLLRLITGIAGDPHSIMNSLNWKHKNIKTIAEVAGLTVPDFLDNLEEEFEKHLDIFEISYGVYGGSGEWTLNEKLLNKMYNKITDEEKEFAHDFLFFFGRKSFIIDEDDKLRVIYNKESILTFISSSQVNEIYSENSPSTQYTEMMKEFIEENLNLVEDVIEKTNEIVFQ